MYIPQNSGDWKRKTNMKSKLGLYEACIGIHTNVVVPHSLDHYGTGYLKQTSKGDWGLFRPIVSAFRTVRGSDFGLVSMDG